MLHTTQRTLGSLARCPGHADLDFGRSETAGRHADPTQDQLRSFSAGFRRRPGEAPCRSLAPNCSSAPPSRTVWSARRSSSSFVDAEVTPRFPDGLTVVKADGQFRGEDNNIIKEKSFVLILLYPFESYSKSSQRIQRIRDLYKEQFKQQSVLRVDDPYTVWVSF